MSWLTLEGDLQGPEVTEEKLFLITPLDMRKEAERLLHAAGKRGKRPRFYRSVITISEKSFDAFALDIGEGKFMVATNGDSEVIEADSYEDAFTYMEQDAPFWPFLPFD